MNIFDCLIYISLAHIYPFNIFYSSWTLIQMNLTYVRVAKFSVTKCFLISYLFPFFFFLLPPYFCSFVPLPFLFLFFYLLFFLPSLFYLLSFNYLQHTPDEISHFPIGGFVTVIIKSLVTIIYINKVTRCKMIKNA